MESEEQQVGPQDGDHIDEGQGNPDTQMEGPSTEVVREVTEETPGFHPEETEDLFGSGQDIARSLVEAALRVVAEVPEGVMESGMDWGRAEPSQGKAEELENVEGESKTKGLEEGEQEGKLAVLSLDQSDGISSVPDQMETQKSVQMEEKEVTEGGEIIIVEMSEKEAEELSRKDHEEAEKLVKQDGSDAGERSIEGDQYKAFVAHDERVAEETTGMVDVLPPVEKVEEGLGPNQKRPEGESGEKVVESAMTQGDVEDLGGLSEKDTQKVTGWEESSDTAVILAEAEVIPETDLKEAEDGIVVGVTPAEGQRDSKELVGPGQEESNVLSGEDLQISSVDQGEAGVLGPGQEGPEKASEWIEAVVASALDQAVEDKVPEVDQGEAERAEALTMADSLFGATDVEEEKLKEDVVPAVDEVGVEKVEGTPQEAVKETTAERDVALAESENLLGGNQRGDEEVTSEKDVTPALDKRETGEVPGAEDSDRLTGEGDVIAGVGQEEAEGETGKEDILPVVVMGEVVTMDVGETEDLLVPSRSVPTLDYRKIEELVGVDKEEAEWVSTKGEAAPTLAEDLLVADLEKSAEVVGKEEMAPAVHQVTLGEELGLVSGKREAEATVSLGEAEEVVEVPGQYQVVGARAIEKKVVLSEEKLGDLTGSERGGAEELIAPWKEIEGGKVALAADLEVAGVGAEALHEYPGGAVEIRVLAPEKAVGLRPELEKEIAEQEIPGVETEEGVSGLYHERAEKMTKPTIEKSVMLARVEWAAADRSLNEGKVESKLPSQGLRVPGEIGRSASAMSSPLSRTSDTGRPDQHRSRGKRIRGLAGLRQGPGVITHYGMRQSAGVINGVLDHRAPGLIITSLTAQAQTEQNRLSKQGHKPLKLGAVDKRGTRSAEQVRVGIRTTVDRNIALIGHRTGREGMSSLSQERQFWSKESLQVPLFEEKGGIFDQKQADAQKKEQEIMKLEMLGKDTNGLAGRQHLEEVQLPQLDGLLTPSYEVPRPRSGWTASLGPGHGLSLRPLRAKTKGEFDLRVVGRGAFRSAGHTPEPPSFETRNRVLRLATRSADVHWVKEVLRPERSPSPFSIAGHSSTAEGSSELTAERLSPGLLRGKQELKDWRDGVMGIAIRKYKAMRLAMWGEGPKGLEVKGVKLSASLERIQDSVLLGRIERERQTLSQLVRNENAPVLAVEGKVLSDVLAQGVGMARSSLPQESETLEVEPDREEEFTAHKDNSETGSPERRLGCQGTQELDGSSQWLADQNEAGSQHALEEDTSTTTRNEAIGTRGKEQERIKMQNSPTQQHHALHSQIASDRMTGSNPVSPASPGSPASSGSISPPHLTHDSSLDSHLGFDGPKIQNRTLVSPGMYTSADPASMWDKTHAEIAEQAKHEAEIENRIAEMKKEGFWSLKRLSKVPEPTRPKVHWDYLCEEMQWLSADFAQERRWKRGVARKVVRMVIRHHEEQKQKEERAKREEQAKLRRIASSIAKEVKQFWSNVEKVVQFKQQSRLEEKRKKALDLQLDFIVGQTEKYSDLLTQSLNETLPVTSKTSSSHAGSTASSPPPPSQLIEDEDGDFQPHEESDDEETIEVEEQQEGNDSEAQQREIELLKQEGELPLEELLQSLPPQILENSFSMSPCASSSDNEEEEEDSEDEEEQEEKHISKKEKLKPVAQRNKKPWKPEEEDEEFTANEDEAEDEEETIDAEEKLEGDVDHSQELDDLAKEGELPMEELLQKYAGAYASDFEMEESDASSEASEPSTSEYEEESEEDTSSQSDCTEEVGSEQDESEEEVAIEEEASARQEEDFGVEYLLKQDEDREGEGENDSAPAPGPKKEITDIAAAAESLQPKGYTLATTQVKTPIPYLLRGTLREYQHIGLDWLVTMYEKKLNGILADEMGLGKTIQTISLLAHLACEKGSWGPHLIIVPTSVMLNWEMEIKRWCPSFKILTYYGAQKERKLKRQGWTKPNAFHICITSYKLVLQDHQAFRRKNWKYLILDEAQNIKNFKSQRWQSLLNFNSQRRLLLTGTPLQNSLMELWSLMHFLMPHVFQSHREFKEWFSNPLTGMIEGSQEYNENLVKRLHKVLRPFLLRRVKVDVEKQMPKKYEHVIKCRLSKRQRYLYDDFMAQATTKETLATGHFMSVINILMQLRKVCNHPNLFDPRPIHSPFITEGICFNTASLVLHALDNDPFKHVDMGIFDLINLEGRVSRYETDTFLPKWKVTRKLIEEIAESPDPPPRPKPVKMKVNRMLQPMPKPENRTVVLVNNPRPAVPLQRPMTPILPETLAPTLAPMHHPDPVLPGSLQSPTLPVSVSLPVPPSPVTMSIPVPPSARPQTPTLVPPLSQNNTAAALLHAQASAPQVLPMAMTTAQLIPNASRLTFPPAPVSPTATTTSSLKLGIVPAPVGQLQAANTIAMSTMGQPQVANTLGMPAMGQLQGMSVMGQLQAPNSLATSIMGQPQAPSALTMPAVGQLQGMSIVGQPQVPNTQALSIVGHPQAMSAVGQPQALNTLAMSAMGQPQAPNTVALPAVGQPQALPTMGQPQAPNTLAVSAMGQPQAPNTLAVSAVGQPQALNTQAVPAVGQSQAPSTLAMPVMGQPQAPNVLAVSAVGQPQAPSTLTVSAMGQPQAPNTLPVPAVGHPQAMSIMGQPQAATGPAMSAVGQSQTPNTLAMSTVGQQQAPNAMGPVPAAQQSTSTMGPGTVGGMLKPMNVHSAVPGLPGYNFATAGALQQRLLLSPDMQARLPSGEVVSIGQLASLANRPLQSAPGSKPLTFQIQGNKLTLTGTQVRQVTMPQPSRQLPRNVVHLLSAGGQHHIISQPTQVALIQAMAQQTGQSPVGVQAVPGHQPPTILPAPATTTAAAAVASTATISVPIAATQVPSSAVNSSGVVKIVVRQAPRDGLVSPSPSPQQPPLRPATPPTAGALPSLSASLMAQRAPLPMNPVPPVRLPTQPQIPVRSSTPAPLQALVRPTLRMLQAPNPSMEQQMVSASLPSSVAPFAISPAGTVTVSASPAMVPQTASSPVPREEPEMLMLRSTTPTPPPPSILAPRPRRQPPPPPRSPFYLESLDDKRKKQKEERLDRLFRLNEQHCNLAPIYGTEVLRFCTLFPPAPASWRNEEEGSDEQMVAAHDVEPKGWRGVSYTHCYAAQVQRDPQSLAAYWQRSETLAQAILTPQQRIEQLTDIIERFIFVMPPVEAPAITMHTSHPPPSLLLQQAVFRETLRQELSSRASCLHRIVCNMRTQFPDLRLIQYDCGKLQTLDVLLRQLKAGAHRVLIFTQMTRMLDVLEQFLNYHGHIYLRLDGSTRVEQRQALMERFNADKRIFCFILSTRSGGVGVNLTGADTVVFYDSDWNPTMDAQAQDRCHRIGQTRDVHIYRLISERTVEENILKKANQKRMLGDMAIEGGNFTTAYFKQQTIRDLFDMPLDEPGKKEGEAPPPAQEEEEDPMATKQAQILEQALCRAEDPEDIRAATQAKAEQVAELAEFNENIPLDAEDRPSREEEEEMSRAEQEIASLVEQLTPIERYAMNFLEASLEDISREELKQAEEQVEAARKDIDQAKDEVVFKLPEDEDESLLIEEVSSKKSKKAKLSSRLASERTGTRVSERLRSTRQMLRDGEGGDAEGPQGRLPNLRHSRVAAEEEEDSLPQVAQHTRGAAVRRELVRDETPAHPVPHTRRTMVHREELWMKSPAAGERLQKTAPYRTEAFTSSDRVLRTNPHRTDTSPVGEKSLRVTPPKPDLGAAGDRIQRGSQPTGDRLSRGAPQRTDSSVDKVLRLGQQKPEKPIGLDKLQSILPRPEAPTSEAQIPQLHPQGLDREAVRLKVDLKEQKGDTSPFCLSSSELQASKDVPGVELAACLAQDDAVAFGKPVNIQTPAETEKAFLDKAPGPVSPVATVELPCESKLEDAHKVGLAVGVQEESVSKPEENTCKGSTVGQQDSLNFVKDVTTQEVQEGIPLDSADRTVSEGAISRSSETPVEDTGRATAESLSKATKVEVPVLTSPDHSVAAAGELPQLDILPCVKEHNGLEQPPRTGSLPHPVPNSLNEPKPKTSPPDTVLPTPGPASSETSRLKESPRQGQGVVGNPLPGDEPQNKQAEVPASSTEADSVRESPLAAAAAISPGALFSDENPSPARVPRRRTSADVLILQSGQGKDGPAAKVLRKLPGRLVTVVEEKELIRRRRTRMRKLDAASSAVLSPSNSSAQSVSEPETSPSGKELPLLRDLPARRRMELESRAAAKEKDGCSREELLVNASTEPVKRKRGRPPKNKSPEQQRSGLPKPCLESALETNPQSKELEKKMPEVQPPNKALEKKIPKTISAKRESPKNKIQSSKNDSPVEKRRRGRPPKVREPPLIPPKPPASDMPPATLTKPLVTELSSKVSEQPNSPVGVAPVTEATSRVRESAGLHPKSASVSKTSPQGRNRMTTHPKLTSKSVPKAKVLAAKPPKSLSKSSPEACEPLASPPTSQLSSEMQGLPSPRPPPQPHSSAETPPKRKRGRPPKNSPSSCVEVAQPQPSTSDQETSIEKQAPAPPVRKRRRRRRKDELGPALPNVNQSSSEGEDARPLTRLALLKREEKPESGSEGLAQLSPKHVVTEGPSSAESSTGEQPSSDTPSRSTRLRPGSLVPPLERETQRRKRRCSLGSSQVSTSSKSPVPQAASEQEGGESESSLRSSSESSGNKSTQQPKRQCYESGGARGRGRGQRHRGGLADRILRSAAKPSEGTRSASSPIPTRKAGSASASTLAGASTGAPSTATSPAALLTSSLSNRGRKPKT